MSYERAEQAPGGADATLRTLAEGRGASTQRRLLNAARESMMQNGFFGADTRDIAERAGLPEHVLWRHFDSRYDLCLAVLAGAVGR